MRPPFLPLVFLTAALGSPAIAQIEPRFSSVSAGSQHTCALTTEGKA
jgi:hypothetical protein